MIKKKTEVPNSLTPGFVYFIGAGDAIKIGFASVVTERLKSLQIGTHNDLKLLAQVPGNRLLEKEYHDRFKYHLIRGEWFRSDAEPILQEINRINGVVPLPEPVLVRRPPNPFAKDIGALIKQQGDYRADPVIFELFNGLVGGLREWPHADPEAKAYIAKNLNWTRAELAGEYGITAGT